MGEKRIIQNRCSEKWSKGFDPDIKWEGSFILTKRCDASLDLPKWKIQQRCNIIPIVILVILKLYQWLILIDRKWIKKWLNCWQRVVNYITEYWNSTGKNYLCKCAKWEISMWDSSSNIIMRILSWITTWNFIRNGMIIMNKWRVRESTRQLEILQKKKKAYLRMTKKKLCGY